MGLIIISFVIGCLVFVGLGILLGTLIHRTWFSENNPDLAWVYVKHGNEVKRYKGNYIHSTKLGYSYRYNHNKNVVVLPKNRDKYPLVFHKHRLVIEVVFGNIIASQPSNTQVDTTIDKPTLVQDMILSSLGSSVVRAMSSSKTSAMSIMMVIIIVIVVIVGATFGYQYLSKQQSTTAPSAPTQQVLPPSGEVK